MSKDTRINVYLHEWKDILEEFFVEQHGDISRIIRELVQGFLKGEIMFIDPKVYDLLDNGKDEEAKEIIVAALQPLRERRLRIGEAVSKRKAAARKNKGLKKAGVQTQEQREAESFHQAMLEKYRQKKSQKGGDTVEKGS